MRIIIECDNCGNRFDVSVLAKKTLQFRDNLENQNFYYQNENFVNGKMKEFEIRCAKCNNWITLSVD